MTKGDRDMMPKGAGIGVEMKPGRVERARARHWLSLGVLLVPSAWASQVVANDDRLATLLRDGQVASSSGLSFGGHGQNTGGVG